MIDKYKSTKCIGNLFGPGNSKRQTKPTTNRLIQRKLKLDRKSASTVKVEIENEQGISLHVDTIRKRAHEVGRFGPVAHEKSFVNHINRGKRFKFGKEMHEKSVDFWKNAVWPDESKCNLSGSNGKVMISRTPREGFNPKCTMPTIRHSGGSVMVWGSFTLSESRKTVCIGSYYGQILLSRYFLGQNLQPSINHFKLGQQCIFMQVIMILNISQD